MKNRLTIFSSVLIIIIWFFISKIVDQSLIVPSPKETINYLYSVIINDNFFKTVSASIIRTVTSFIISFILAIIFNILSKRFMFFKTMLQPVILITKSIPTMAIILIGLVWFKASYAPIYVGFFIVFPLLYNGLNDSIKQVDKNLIEMSKFYNIPKNRIIKEIYVPSIFPNIIGLTTASIGVTLKVIIGSEVISQPEYGIGTEMIKEANLINSVGIFSWAIIAIVIIGVFDYLLKKLRGYYVKE